MNTVLTILERLLEVYTAFSVVLCNLLEFHVGIISATMTVANSLKNITSLNMSLSHVAGSI